MVRRWDGGFITTQNIAGNVDLGSAIGVWTLNEADRYSSDGKWPTYPLNIDQIEYTTAGSYSFVAASPVVSIVCVGGGGAVGWGVL
jgi:hypothetical protein